MDLTGPVLNVLSYAAILFALDALVRLANRSKELRIEKEQRRITELALKENISRLEIALKSAQIGTWQLDLRTGLAQLSEDAARILGLSVTQADVTALLARILHPEDSLEVDRVWKRAVETVSSYSHEFRIIRPSGEVRWLLSQGKVHDDGPDGKRLFSGIVADVTERKSTEEAFHASEARFRNAIKATNDAIWEWNLVTNEVAWNDAVYELFGFAKDSVGSTAQWWLDHIHPEDRAGVERGIHEAIDHGADHWSDRYRFRRADDVYAPVLDRGFIARNGEGKPERMIGAMQDLTALSLLAQTMEESQKRFERVLESVEVGLWYCDLPFDLLIWDARVKTHFWLPPDAGVNIGTFYERIHPDDRVRTQASIEKSIVDHSTYDIEYRTCEIDGPGIKWIRAIGSTSYDENGAPIRFDGLTLDLTAEKETTQALAEKQRHLSLALTAGRLGSWEIDVRANRGHVSESLGKILGLGPGELEGSASFFGEFTHEDDRERSRSEFELALEQGKEGVQLEYRVLSRTGEVRWFSSHMLLVGKGNAALERIVGVSMDITERKHNELALAASEERFRSLASAIPQIVWATSTGGEDEYYNDRWFNYTGLPQTKAARSRNAIHPDDMSRVLTEAAKGEREENPWTSEYRLRRHDGEYRWHLGRCVPVRTSHGELVRWVGTATDIDDQKRFSELLERRVEERTSALKATNQELESFSYSVSHDLRAPLRGIDGFSRMLESRFGNSISDEGREFIRRIRAATSRMGTLIDDMLQLSRVTRREMRRDTLDLSAMVNEIALDLRTRDAGRKVAFEIQEGVVAHADGTLLRAVLENLLGNAWKFTGKKTEASIRFSTTISSGETVYFVSDNGAGFDMEYSRRLFSAFARLHTEEEFEGTGIGLATVQRVINRHGGRVWAQGTVGQGATFSFTLGPSILTPHPEKEGTHDVHSF